MSIHQASIVIPSDPNERKKMENSIKEISNSLTRIESEKDNIKSIVSDMVDVYTIPKTIINRIAKIYHKQSSATDFGQMEDTQALYETLFETDEEG